MNTQQTPAGFSRKIDPARAPLKPDGTPNDPDRIEIGPTDLAFAEWLSAGITPPNLTAMRCFRLNRIVEKLHERNYAGILLFDPLNIRYASDTTNMQLWNTHNPFRACLVLADGYMIMWDYKNSPFLSDFNPLVREVRSGASMYYFGAGDHAELAAARLAAEVNQVLAEHCGDNRRLAIDKIMIDGLRAFEAAGVTVFSGEEAMEKARVIKGPDDILAMRCAVHACEAAVAEMREAAIPGLSEDEIWAVLHAENIRRGGEWIETRLLATGPRTNPWFQECGPRILQNNEILAFDTDMVGVYGMCCDISRTWFIGDGQPSDLHKELHAVALEHILTNAELVKPGTTFRELVFEGHQLDERFHAQKYSCRFHGVGLCDEWPHIAYPQDYEEGAFEAVLEPGMTLCVEALIGLDGGDFCIKLEDQLLVTETGYENLTRCPFDEKLTA